MGEYVRDEAHSQTRGSSVFSLKGSLGVHLSQATSNTWYISDTADMLAGRGVGWITSTTASSIPLGLEWQISGRVWGFTLDPLIKVAKPIDAIRMTGHTGKQKGKMGVYARDASHSHARGRDIYSLEGVSGVYMYQSKDGKWRISGTKEMVMGNTTCYISSTAASPSPLCLKWKYSNSGYKDDPQIKVAEISAAELAGVRSVLQTDTQRILGGLRTGERVVARYKGGDRFLGKVKSFDAGSKTYHVIFDDGDEEPKCPAKNVSLRWHY